MTDEKALKAARAIWLNFYPFVLSRDIAAWRAGIQAARELLSAEAPPACPAPIHGMTVDEIYSAIIQSPEWADRGISVERIAAIVAHRLAQPTPAVDRDKDAMVLCGAFTRLTSRALKTMSNAQIWENISDNERIGWRAVAAAKAGKGK